MSFESPLPPYNASDPSATFLSSSCLDLLLIELVPLAYRLANELDASERESIAGFAENAAWNADRASENVSVGKRGLGGAAVATTRIEAKMDDDEERDAVFYRLEILGYRVGQGLVERFSRDRPRFTDTLDVIKFLCKDLWMLVFRKQIDNLKTNHRGVYVLTDNSFRPFARMSTEAGGQAVIRAQPFLWFPCGIIRGALASMGISASVQAETSELPGATFQIKSIAAKS
ncbi:MAG: Trafficking protein particle complex subunit 33 [Claussenomyces sp. TS43310]|nr:MAG: Trafficking protein particle complex subunit 33 [Claussenomyces sp. TS43310]